MNCPALSCCRSRVEAAIISPGFVSRRSSLRLYKTKHCPVTQAMFAPALCGFASADAAARWRIDLIQMRDHFARSTLTRDPAELVLCIGFLEALVCHQRSKAVACYASSDSAIVARRQVIYAHQAVGELDRIATVI